MIRREIELRILTAAIRGSSLAWTAWAIGFACGAWVPRQKLVVA